MHLKNLAVLSVVLLGLFVAQTMSQLPAPGAKYLGQKPPGEEPELFAPGIVNNGLLTRDVAMTPDGTEIYFGIALANYSFSAILMTRLTENGWTPPEVVPSLGDMKYMQLEPCISPDGGTFLFLSTRPDSDGVEGDQDIWVMDRQGDHWGQPYNLGEPVNSIHSEYFPSLTRDRTLYFTRSENGSRQSFIYRSEWRGGQYQQPEKLPAQVNCGQSQYNAFVAPDESFLIVPAVGREDAYGGTDYYVVFHNADDSWSEPVNMGEKVNTHNGLEYSPYVSPDGKYFFFMSTRFLPQDQWPDQLTASFLKELHNRPGNGNPAIYWMDAAFIEQLRPR